MKFRFDFLKQGFSSSDSRRIESPLSAVHSARVQAKRNRILQTMSICAIKFYVLAVKKETPSD